MAVNHKVLVVDDEEEIREFLNEYMCDRGDYEVIQASSLAETIRLMNSHDDLKLVLLDLVMPDSQGLEALDAVKQVDKNLPVVVLTGYPGLKESVISRGANLHFDKPFSVREVEKSVRAQITQAEARASI